jgi:Spy/CpxP family protein refolding chaperone
MIRKLALGLFAAASISAAVLAPTAASAKNWGNNWGGGWGYHHRHFGIGFVGPAVDPCLAVTPSGRLVNVCY